MPLMQSITDSAPPRTGVPILRLMDITQPEGEVQVQISADGKVLWVHIEGQTVLRICRCERITIDNQNQEVRLYSKEDLQDQLGEEWQAGYDYAKEHPDA